MRRITYTIILLLGISLNSVLLTDVFAQRGGGGGGGGRGGGGGGGQGGGPRGLGDLRGSARQSPFSDLPWDAQKLLEANRPTMQKLPRPLQGFIVNSVKNWDSFFPIRKQQFEIFFKKAEKAERQELIEAFQDAMPMGFRNRAQNRGQRQDGPEGAEQRPSRGQRQRGGPNAAINLTAEQINTIDKAFQKYVLPDQDTTPGIILVYLTGEKTHKPWEDTLTQQGSLFTKIAVPTNTTDALATLQTGHANAHKGKTLSTPSLFEYANQTLNDKTHHRTLAFFQTPNPPPFVSKTKGYGKKFRPLSLELDKLSDIATTIEQELGKAIQQGKSDRYIELMVKPKLTPEALKIKKVVKEPALQHLTLQTLLDYRLSRQLGSAFIQAITNKAILEGVPDVVISQFDKDDNTSTFLNSLFESLRTHPRYQNGGTLAIIDHQQGQALLLGNSVKSNTQIDTDHALEDITATLASFAHLQTSHIQGTAISSIKTKP